MHLSPRSSDFQSAPELATQSSAHIHSSSPARPPANPLPGLLTDPLASALSLDRLASTIPTIATRSGSQTILMITPSAGAELCATSLAGTVGWPVEIAASRKQGLAALRRREYAAVIVDESIAAADPGGAELLWKHSGLAVPLQINFALLGCARLGREVKAALHRREQEQSLAMRAATTTLENSLKSTVTGLLLQSELALAEPSVSAPLAAKLKLMVELAGTLRRQLEQPRL